MNYSPVIIGMILKVDTLVDVQLPQATGVHRGESMAMWLWA